MVVVEGLAGEFFELFVGAEDFDGVGFFAFPDWHGGGPETVAREVPVGSSFDVFSKTAVF